MKIRFFLAVLAVTAGFCGVPAVVSATETDVPETKPFTPDQLEKLLHQRLSGELGLDFAHYANMFIVQSNIELGVTVGLMTPSGEIQKASLMTLFPEFYKPTFKEFLDVIALQVGASWECDYSGKYINDKTGKHSPLFPVFEFKKTNKEKPYDVTFAKGWTSVDKGCWTMFVPPNFPLGMDIYEVGEYSCDDGAQEPKLFKKVPIEVSLQWAKRVKPDTAAKDLKPAKVGKYEALFFDAMIPSQMGKPVHWRQWVFVAERKCYFVVSTIFPEYEEQLLPDVESMLKTFVTKKPGR